MATAFAVFVIQLVPEAAGGACPCACVASAAPALEATGMAKKQAARDIRRRAVRMADSNDEGLSGVCACAWVAH